MRASSLLVPIDSPDMLSKPLIGTSLFEYSEVIEYLNLFDLIV